MQMKSLDFVRYALCCGAAAMLAACGRSQLPIGAAGVVPEQTRMHPPYSVLYSFEGGPDGGFPYASLINVKGTLYGTTEFQGATGYGTVFEVTTSGAETVLHSFAGAPDGEDPFAALVNVKGTLYSTTIRGGSAGSFGTVFAISASGTEKVI